MLNISDSRFVTVFQPEIKLSISEHMVFANISTSEKVSDNNGNISYKNMSWKARFVGSAFEPAKALRDKDKIDILKGCIKNRYDKDNKILYVDVVIFEYVMSEKSTKASTEAELGEAPPLPDEPPQDYPCYEDNFQ